jgi:hypothetical protein
MYTLVLCESKPVILTRLNIDIFIILEAKRMGWLGVCLIFVGIALLSNGVAAIIKMDGKSAAGFLFGFTYVFIAANHLWNNV